MVYITKHKVLWLIKNRGQIEMQKRISDELLNVAEVYFGKKGA